jgi:hypothetical protein
VQKKNSHRVVTQNSTRYKIIKLFAKIRLRNRSSQFVPAAILTLYHDKRTKKILFFAMDGVDSIRRVLLQETIILDKQEDVTGMFDHADAFVNLTRDNKTVEEVRLRLDTDPDAHRYAIWDKIAEGIGNLHALHVIVIVDTSIDDGEEDPLAPDWEILACILRRLRHGIQLHIEDDEAPQLWHTETLPAFAGVIHGHAMITRLSTGNGFPFHCLDILCSALLTLPALESVSFGQLGDEGPEEGQSLESMIELLQSPSLREVQFVSVDFTRTLSKAVAKALKERSKITDLRLLYCSFPEGGGAVIASALKTNTTLNTVNFVSGFDEIFYEALAAALLSNSTLQELELSTTGGLGYNAGSCSWLTPFFLSLQVNTGLKKLRINRIDLIDEKVSTAMRLGLGNNSTLKSLSFLWITAHNETSLWREALSFLHTNTALETLDMHFEHNVKKSLADAIRMELPAALRENESLEALSLLSDDVRSEDYLEFVAAIQPNETLKSLRLCPMNGNTFRLDEDGMKDLIPILKKNYGLEEIRELCHDSEDIRSILKLNRAGRRYLVQDGSSISKGVDVLSRVSSDTNSVFMHLLENPRLCDRSAVEMLSSIGNTDNVRSMSPENCQSGGK